jgi:lysozyme
MHDQQRAELAGDEGRRLTVYDDATGRAVTPGYCMRGHPTVGVGRALDVHGLTNAEVDYLFSGDIATIEQALGTLAWYVALDDVRRGVMVNLAFNLGLRGLEAFVSMIADLRNAEHDLALALSLLATQQFEAAAAELAASKWARQVQPSRRDRLIAQLRTGQLAAPQLPSPPPAPTPPAPTAREVAATEALNEQAETEALNQAQIDKGKSA